MRNEFIVAGIIGFRHSRYSRDIPKDVGAASEQSKAACLLGVIDRLRCDFEYCSQTAGAPELSCAVEVARCVPDQTAERTLSVRAVGEVVQHFLRPLSIRSQSESDDDLQIPALSLGRSSRFVGDHDHRFRLHYVKSSKQGKSVVRCPPPSPSYCVVGNVIGGHFCVSRPLAGV